MPSVMLPNSRGKVSAQCRESRKSLWLDACSLNQGGVSPLWFNQIGKMTMRFLNRIRKIRMWFPKPVPDFRAAVLTNVAFCDDVFGCILLVMIKPNKIPILSLYSTDY